MFHIHEYIHGLISHYFGNKEMDELYASVGVKALADSLIQIFVPVYLYRLGFSVSNIALYFIIMFTSLLIFMYLAMRYGFRFGLKKILAVGTLILAGYYFLLNMLSSNLIHYSVVALMFGLSAGIYYSAFHIFFAKFSDRNHEASQVSIMRSLVKIAAVVGPIIGALLIKEESFNILFYIVSGLLVISLVPLVFSKDRKVRALKVSFKSALKSDSKEKMIAYNATGVLGVTTGLLWPLFIFITIREIVSLGLIISAASLLSVCFLFVIGGLSDRHKRKILKLGVFSHSISWLIRIFWLSPFGVFLINIYSSLTWILIDLPFAKLTYEKGRKSKNITNYFLFREINLFTGRLFVLSLVFFTGELYWAFIVSFFATFLYLSLLKDKKNFSLINLLP